jgi:hypothetical protein
LVDGDDIEDQREHHNQNGEENEKCSKIFHNLHNHGNDVTQFHEDSKEKEKFHEAEEDHYDHYALWNNFQRFHVQLAIDVEIAKADMSNVQGVPWVLAILLDALHHQLVAIVDKWID